MPTSWLGLLGAALVVVAAIPLLVGNMGWWTVILGALGAIFGLVARRSSAQQTPGTRFALLAASLMGAVVALLGLVTVWTSAPVTLYGENWGEQRGELRTIQEFQAMLPCVDEPTSPASADQTFYRLEITSFAASISCHISAAEGVQPAVFVQADSSEALDAVFASGVIHANGLKDHELWVSRDGAVAVITADEESEDLAQDAARHWIHLDDEEPS